MSRTSGKKFPLTIRQTIYLALGLALLAFILARTLAPAHVKFRRLVEKTILRPAEIVSYLAGELDIGAVTGGMAGDEQNSVVRILTVFSDLNTLPGKASAESVRSTKDILLSMFNQQNVHAAQQEVSLFSGEEKVVCRLYTFTPSRADLTGMLTNLSQLASDNAELFTLSKAFYVAQKMETDNTTETLATHAFEEKWTNFTDGETADIEAFADTLLANGFTFTLAVDGNRLKLLDTAFTADGSDVMIRYASDGGTLSSRQDRIEIKAGTAEDIVLDNSYVLSFPNLTGTLGTTGNGVTDVNEYDILLWG